MAEELLRSEMPMWLFIFGAVGVILGAVGSWGVLTELGRVSIRALRQSLKAAEDDRTTMSAQNDERWSEARRAFDAWRSWEHQTRGALEEKTKEYSKLQKENEELKRKRPSREGTPSEVTLARRQYPIFLDGLSESGKTTFARRFLMPTLSLEELQQEGSATSQAGRSSALPIVVVDEEGAPTTLHEVYFYDTAGENGNTLLDCLDSYKNSDKRRDSSDQKGVILFVWDCSKPEEENRKFLEGHVKNVYGANIARETVKAVVILFNKVDRIEPELHGAARERVVNERLKNLWTGNIQKMMIELTNRTKIPVDYLVGSMKSGAGIQQCFGRILSRLALPLPLKHEFELVDKSLANEVPLTPVTTRDDLTGSRP